MEQFFFNFLNEPFSCEDEYFKISTVDDFEETCESFRLAYIPGSKWYHPAMISDGADGEGFPYQRFELPISHFIISKADIRGGEYVDFLIQVLGFILGLHLVPEGIGHLWSTPLQRGRLVGFCPTRREVLYCLKQVSAFWDEYPQARRIMFGAIHWFLVSQHYRHQYEQFAWMYSVLDTLHSVALHTSFGYRAKFPNPRSGHGKRPKALAETFGSPLPTSFRDPSREVGDVSALIEARNKLIHEARWSDEPLGYSVNEAGQWIIYEMSHFCSQIILGLLRVDCDFRSQVYDRSSFGLDVHFGA